MSKCKRCGKCCQNGDFWWDSNHPLIKKFFDRTAGRNKEQGQCLMLEIENGIAFCLIEKYLGRKYKPEVCKDYPSKDEKCFYEKD